MFLLVLTLLQVFKLAYCDYYHPDKEEDWKTICSSFVEAAKDYPPMNKKLKVHLMLHLIDNMKEFGPTSAFNIER